MYSNAPTVSYHGRRHDVGIRNEFARLSTDGYLPAEIRPVIGAPLLKISGQYFQNNTQKQTKDKKIIADDKKRSKIRKL